MNRWKRCRKPKGEGRENSRQTGKGSAIGQTSDDKEDQVVKVNKGRATSQRGEVGRGTEKPSKLETKVAVSK